MIGPAGMPSHKNAAILHKTKSEISSKQRFHFFTNYFIFIHNIHSGFDQVALVILIRSLLWQIDPAVVPVKQISARSIGTFPENFIEIDPAVSDCIYIHTSTFIYIAEQLLSQSVSLSHKTIFIIRVQKYKLQRT